MKRISINCQPLLPMGATSVVPLYLARRLAIPLSYNKVPFHIEIHGNRSIGGDSSGRIGGSSSGDSNDSSLHKLLSRSSVSAAAGGTDASSKNSMLSPATSQHFQQQQEQNQQLYYHTTSLLFSLNALCDRVFDAPDDLRTVVLGHRRLLDAVSELDKWLGSSYFSSVEGESGEGGTTTELDLLLRTVTTSSPSPAPSSSSSSSSSHPPLLVSSLLVPVLHMAKYHLGMMLGPYPHVSQLLRETTTIPADEEGHLSGSQKEGESERNHLQTAFHQVLEVESKIPSIVEYLETHRDTCPYKDILLTIGEVVKSHHTMEPRETSIHHAEGTRERNALKKHRNGGGRLGFQASVSTVKWTTRFKGQPPAFNIYRKPGRKAMD